MPLYLKDLPGAPRPKVTLLIVTDGRWEYLQQTWASAQENLKYDWHEVVVVDDSADLHHWRRVADLINPDVYLPHTTKQGGAQSIRTAWQYLRETGCDYVFHLEEDWTFNQPVEVEDLARISRHKRCANVVLRRQPWGGEGPDGYLGDNPEAFKECASFLSHGEGFWLNPCLYRRWVTALDWPVHGDEGHFSAELARSGYWFAVYGQRNDPPRVHHIGNDRSTVWAW